MAVAGSLGASVRKYPIPGVKQIILVTSGKGGVGKSTTAVNVALSIAGRNNQNNENGLKKVGLLDADVYGPSIPKMMGLVGPPPALEDKLQSYMSMAILMSQKEAVAWRGLRVMQAVETMFRKVKWGSLDYLIVDMPPGNGDAHLMMSQRIPITGSIIVSTPQKVALIDAKKALDICRHIQVPVLGIIENMASFACPKCGEQTRLFGSDHEIRKLAEEYRVPALGTLPFEPEVVNTMDEGKPVVVSAPDSPIAKLYGEITDQVLKNLPAFKTSRTPPSYELHGCSTRRS